MSRSISFVCTIASSLIAVPWTKSRGVALSQRLFSPGLAIVIAVASSLISATGVHAAVIQVLDATVNPGGVTDFFGDQNGGADAGDAAGLLFDETRTGGGDTGVMSSVFNPARTLAGVAGTNSNWAAGLPLGTPGGNINFTGLGFALGGDANNNTAAQVSLNIVYLGADGNVGGTDDEVVGSVTDNFTYGGAGEYAWGFDNPLPFTWDGANNRFRLEIAGVNGFLRFKQRSVAESPSGQGGLVLSVGGNFTPVPEPSTAMLVIFGSIAYWSLRRRS